MVGEAAAATTAGEGAGPSCEEGLPLAAETLSPSRRGASPARSFASLHLSPVRRAPPPALIAVGKGSVEPFPGKRIPAAGVAAALAPSVMKVVRVGLACIVTNPVKPGCVLVGKRKGSIGAGTLGLPGGNILITLWGGGGGRWFCRVFF